MSWRSPLYSLLALLLFSPAGQSLAHPHILHIESGKEIGYQELLDDLDDVQVIFIGELHDHAGHHRMQYEVIRGLKERSLPVAVGLEMFQIDDQPALDQWIDHTIDEKDFVSIFNRNWSMWPVYRQIFHYAREDGVPLVALNISRDITRKVARDGFDSLAAEQLNGLDGVTCIIDPAYEKFIQRSLGGHAHGQTSFIYFCEAQLLWDTAMAIHLVDFLEKNPGYKVVVLAGSGHSWKYGIPDRMLQLASLEYRVILPEISVRINRNNATNQDADYLWLDFGGDSWEVYR